MATDNVFVVPDEAWTAWVSVWERQHTKSYSKCMDAYCGRKKQIFAKYDLGKQH